MLFHEFGVPEITRLSPTWCSQHSSASPASTFPSIPGCSTSSVLLILTLCSGFRLSIKPRQGAKLEDGDRGKSIFGQFTDRLSPTCHTHVGTKALVKAHTRVRQAGRAVAFPTHQTGPAQQRDRYPSLSGRHLDTPPIDYMNCLWGHMRAMYIARSHKRSRIRKEHSASRKWNKQYHFT